MFKREAPHVISSFQTHLESGLLGYHSSRRNMSWKNPIVCPAGIELTSKVEVNELSWQYLPARAYRFIKEECTGPSPFVTEEIKPFPGHH
jgi:hypothetical protein